MFGKKIDGEKNEYIHFIMKLFIIVLFIIGLFILYKIGTIIVILFISLFLNILFAPILNILNKWKIGDTLGIILIYLFIFLFIVILFFAIIPIFIKQLSVLIHIISESVNQTILLYNSKGIDALGLPKMIQPILVNFDMNQLLASIKNNIGEISSFMSTHLKNFLTSGAGLFFSITNIVINFLGVMIFSFFIALERKNIRIFFYKIIPQKLSKYLLSKENQIVNTLFKRLKSQFLLSISIFCITFIGLWIMRLFGIKIDDIFTLSFISGMMEFIPVIGPFIALLPALAIALGISYKATIIIFILYIVIQQAENNILVPYIMGKNLSISPFAVIIAMIIGSSLFGIIGMIFAIPMVSIMQIFINDYLQGRKI